MKITGVIMLFVILFSLSCKQETPDIVPQVEKKLKKKLCFHTPQDTVPYYFEEYAYDGQQRLIRTTNSYATIDSFQYNEAGQLVKKLGYSKRYDEYQHVVSTDYEYKDGFLVKESSYDLLYTDPYAYTRYVYKNSRLSEEYQYNYDRHLTSFIQYEYSAGLCRRETWYTDSLGINIATIKNMAYKDGKIVKAEVTAFNGIPLQRIIYTYDPQGNLILEEARQPVKDAIRPYLYLYKYEYY